MKKLITILFILLTLPIYAQWVQLNPVITGTGTIGALNDIYCITEDIVVAVGDNGTIIKTIDGGATWAQKTSGTTYNLLKTQFINETTGYILAEDNNTTKLLKTTDGGENWTFVPNLSDNIYTFFCVNSDIIYIVTTDGYLKKSTNGGDSFNLINATQYFLNIQFLSELKGFAVDASSMPVLYKTIDGGISWTPIGEVDLGSGSAPFFFFSENVGFKKSFNELYKTTDGGSSYTYLTSINHTMDKLFATSENVVWGITVVLLLNGQPNYTTRGEILNTGAFERIDASAPLFKSIYFANPTVGYGVGWDGIFKNTTGTMLGLNKTTEKNIVKIYPNPSSEQITISFNEKPAQPFTIEITDSLGKKVFSKTYDYEDNITINTKSFSKGIYFLTVVNEEKSQTQKLIIN